VPFFMVDDLLHAHRKARKAGLEAMGLWVVAGSYCQSQLTDGFVPDWFVRSWPDGDVAAKRLVDAGLWIKGTSDGEDGYQYHQWYPRQLTKEQVEARRAARSEAGRLGGLRSGQARAQAGAQPVDTAPAPAKPQALAEADAEALASPFAPTNVRSKTQPLSLSLKSSKSVVVLVELLQRAGDPVTTTTLATWAQRHCTAGVDVEDQTRRFLERNAGQTPNDLRAAWQAWMRKARPTPSTIPSPPPADGTIPRDAPRCPVPGHTHEPATHCRLCASERLAGQPQGENP
jgi:hypothetical protein